MVREYQKLKTVFLDPELLFQEGLNCVSISLSEVIERKKRIDASYFDIEGKKARQAVANCPYPKLPLFGENGFSKDVSYPGRFKRVYIPEGLPIYTASQSLELNPSPSKFISTKTKIDLDLLTLKAGQITVTRSGTIGRCTIVTDTLKGKIFSDDLLRINCNNPLEVGYVYAFLKTSIGNKILTTNNYGSVVSHIEPEHLSDVPVPVLPDYKVKEIHGRIMSAFKLRDEANRLIQQANDLLFKRLDLPPLESLKADYLSEKVRSFPRRLDEWKHRLDGSFHIPLIDVIVNEFRKKPAELTSIGDKRVSERIILPGRFKRIYVDKDFGVPFLSGGDIFQYDLTQAKYLSVKHHSKRIKEQLTFHENMILVTCSGTIGNVLLTPKHFENWTGNQHILRIKPNENINAGYVYTFLASSYGQALVKRFTYGSVVDEINDDHLASVQFLLPSAGIQNEIGNLVLEANKKRTEAYLQEKDTIAFLERFILNS